MNTQRWDTILIRAGIACLAVELAVANLLFFHAVSTFRATWGYWLGPAAEAPFMDMLLSQWGPAMFHLPLGGNSLCTFFAFAGVVCLIGGFVMRSQYGPAAPGPYACAPGYVGVGDPAGPRLLCTQGEYANATIPIDARGLVIGRDAGRCGLVLNSGEISRMHARVSFTPGTRQFLIEDLGSTNGIFVGAGRVQGAAAIMPGQNFRLGQSGAAFTVLL